MPTEESESQQEADGGMVESREARQDPGDLSNGPGYAERTVVRRASPFVTWANVIYVVFAVIDGLIAIRFLLKLLAANPQAGFAQLIYGVTAPLMSPFVGLLGNPAASNGSQLEVTSLVAIVVYALVGWLLIRAVVIFLGNRSVTSSRREIS
jgi:YggT family protein